MKTCLRPIIFTVILLQLIGCITVRDKNNKSHGEETSAVETFGADDLLVEEPLYLFDGHLLNQEDLQVTKEKYARNSVSPQKKSELRFNKLVLRQNGIIYTLGNDLHLEIGTLDSQGKIATFPEGSKMLPSFDGFDGGNLQITVEKGRGVLNIYMRGQDGGAGLDGAPPDISMNGQDGKNEMLGGLGVGSFGGSSGSGPLAGGAGHTGNPGGNGGRGGSTGRLELLIINKSQLAYNVWTIPGKGGAKGLGGLGGMGGLNGRRLGQSDGDRTRVKSGDKGHDGNDGVDGQKIEPVIKAY